MGTSVGFVLLREGIDGHYYGARASEVTMFGLGSSHPTLMLSIPELFLILAIVVVVFGAGRLPQLGRGLGEGISNFKEGLGGKGKGESKPLDETKKPQP
jgi:sec-independent protein translocase protein TatA